MMRTNRNSHPLRKILRRDLHVEPGFETPFLKDFLECGHTIPPAQDMIGARYPERRRCHKCTAGREKEFTVDDPEDARFLSNLKRMIVTANKAADKKHYVHGEIELVAIKRVMSANSVVSVPPGVDRVIGNYYEKMTGRKPYY